MNKILSLAVLILLTGIATAQEPLLNFGTELKLEDITRAKKIKERPIQWVQINTEKETWQQKGKELHCSGMPIGVIRSQRQYKNFILHVEWKHLEAGGNSGTFVWSDAKPKKNRLPNGVEIQMLELDWVKLNKRDGKEPPIAYVHGEVFGVGGTKITPDNPRGKRSKSVENRCKGKGEWNTYEVVCVDGTIKLSVNDKFVNGISKSSQKQGYICLESEGAKINFRNIKVIELP